MSNLHDDAHTRIYTNVSGRAHTYATVTLVAINNRNIYVDSDPSSGTHIDMSTGHHANLATDTTATSTDNGVYTNFSIHASLGIQSNTAIYSHMFIHTMHQYSYGHSCDHSTITHAGINPSLVTYEDPAPISSLDTKTNTNERGIGPTTNTTTAISMGTRTQTYTHTTF